MRKYIILRPSLWLILLLALINFSSTTLSQSTAQEKFFASSSISGANSKDSAKVAQFTAESQRRNACNANGFLYLPTHTLADAGGCVDDFFINPTGQIGIGSTTPGTNALQVGGDFNATGNTLVGGTLTATGATQINNTLTVTGLTTASGALHVTGDISVTGGHLLVDGNNISNIPTCNQVTQKLHFSGTAWSCIALSSGSGGGEVDPQVGALSNGRLCRSDGIQVICDQVAYAHAFTTPPACPNDQKLRWNGSAWDCITEADPQVGSLAEGKWCRATGGSVVCDQDDPGASSGGQTFYINTGEDRYTAYHGWCWDSCNGNNNNQYTCPAHETKNCCDRWRYDCYDTTCDGYRNVDCKRVSFQGVLTP